MPKLDLSNTDFYVDGLPPKTRYTVGEKEWYQDEYGWYWAADLFKDGKKVGRTGNYYQIEERRVGRPNGH